MVMITCGHVLVNKLLNYELFVVYNNLSAILLARNVEYVGTDQVRLFTCITSF